MRNAWGSSISTDNDSAMEWELGSRVMNDLEVENDRRTALGALRTRITRARRATPSLGIFETEAEDYLDCLVMREAEPEKMWYCYDIAEDMLLCHLVDPPLGEGTYEYTQFRYDEVTDWMEWDQVEEVSKDAGK